MESFFLSFILLFGIAYSFRQRRINLILALKEMIKGSGFRVKHGMTLRRTTCFGGQATEDGGLPASGGTEDGSLPASGGTEDGK